MHTNKGAALAASLVAAAVAAALLTAPPGATATVGNGERTGSGAQQTQRSVTLVTGDRVTVSASGEVTGFRPGKGRAGVGALTERADGHTYVIPRDAAGLLRTGVLDRGLFDVSRLAKSGYDDARRGDVPMIVGYRGAGAKAQAKSSLRAADVRIERTLPSINADAVAARKSRSAEVWEALTDRQGAGKRTVAPGIEKVWLDGKRRALLDESVPQIGAPEAWEAGYDGTGVNVAVLDTGVDQTHPDLADREIAQSNFSDAPDNVDRYGHGTHVASIATGSGAQSDGAYKGVAPGAKVLDGKVLNDDGWGYDSWIIAGMQWAVDQDAKVVNLSLGGLDSPETDPVEEAVNTLSADSGTVFAIAAGNDGPGKQTISSPGSAEAALTVGAVDKADRLAEFSSRGPTAAGLLKPDVSGPGVNIAAAAAAEGQIGDPVQNGYVSLSGTSMATPHVAGAAAILAQQHPRWTGHQIKAALVNSAEDVSFSPPQQGAGRVDAARSVGQQITAEPCTTGFGLQTWPHDDDQPVSKTVTYSNDGDQPVTLDLTVQEYDSDGSPAAGGVFRVEPASLTVPARGTAAAEVIADTRTGSGTGLISGAVTASGDGQSVRTTMAVEREGEAYELTLRHTGRNGEPTSDYNTWLIGLDSEDYVYPYEEDGSVTLRVPRGRFALHSTILTPGTERVSTDVLTYPMLVVGKNTTVNLDARKAKPLDITVPDRTAVQRLGLVSYEANIDGHFFGQSWWLESYRGFRTAHLGPALRPEQLVTLLNGIWQRPAAGSTHTNYRLAFQRGGSMYTGFTHKTSAAELARITVGLGAAVPGKTGALTVIPVFDSWWGSSGSTYQSLPATSVEYVNASVPRWRMDYVQHSALLDPELEYSTTPKHYSAGKSYTARFNTAVIGPTLKKPGAGVFRSGDMIRASIPLFADSGNHVDGWGYHPAAKTVLYRNGVKIWQDPAPPDGSWIPVPRDKATYKLTTSVYRTPGAAGISVRNTGSWTFTSQHVPGDQEVRLPVSAVRFTPRLSLASTDRAGTSLTVPFTVQGAAAGKNLKSIAIKASYDGGETWKAPKVVRGSYVTLNNPGKPGPVALRATVTDTKGNTMTQTIYRAYLTRR